MQPLISVVTPVYRSEEILARAVGSLLAQDFRDWEAVIVDDGSPDTSWRVVQAYSWIDPRIRTIHETHAGACITRNRGIAEARGKYLLFLDADDWMESDALSALYTACEKNAWIAAHGTLRYVTPEGNPTSWLGGYDGKADLFDAIANSNVLSVPSAAMVRRSVLDDIGTFDPSLVHCGDWDLWARLARHDGEIGHLNQVVTNYRMRPGSLSRSPRTLLRDAMTTLRRIHGPDPRVLHPSPSHAQGADPVQLASRIGYFAIYCAGLAVSGGRYEPAEAVLEMVPRWTELDPQRAAEFIFYAVCFAHCCGPEGVSQFWPDIVEPLHHLLAEIERRSRTRGLAGKMIEAMDACSEEPLSTLPLRVPELPKSTASPDELFSSAYETLAHNALRSLAEQHEAATRPAVMP